MTSAIAEWCQDLRDFFSFIGIRTKSRPRIKGKDNSKARKASGERQMLGKEAAPKSIEADFNVSIDSSPSDSEWHAFGLEC